MPMKGSPEMSKIEKQTELPMDGASKALRDI